MTAPTARQIAVLNNVANNPGCSRADAVDSYYTRGGHYSVRYAYARIKRMERNGWLIDTSDNPTRSALCVTSAGWELLGEDWGVATQ